MTQVAPETTFNDHGKAMLARLADMTARPEAQDLEVFGDLEQAKLHLDDALTRYNSARYRMAGMWDRADSDRVIAERGGAV